MILITTSEYSLQNNTYRGGDVAMWLYGVQVIAYNLEQNATENTNIRLHVCMHTCEISYINIIHVYRLNQCKYN